MLFKIKLVLLVGALPLFCSFSSVAYAQPMSCEGVLIAQATFPDSRVAFEPFGGSTRSVSDAEVFEFHYKNGQIEVLKVDRIFVPITIHGAEHKVLLDEAVINRLSHVFYWGQVQSTEETSDLRQRAFRRGFQIFVNDLRDSGGTLSIEQVSKRIGATSLAEVQSLVEAGELLTIQGQDGSLRFPLIQFQYGGMRIRGIAEVLEALPTKNGAAILNFLITPDRRLKNHRPIDLMRRSLVQPVVASAHLYGEPGR